MKVKAVLPLAASILLTLSLGSSAFAMHVYRNADCSGKLPNGQEIKMAFASGSFPMALLGLDGTPERGDDGYVKSTVDIQGTGLNFSADDQAAKLALQVRYESIVKESVSWGDQCWKYESREFKTVVEVKAVETSLGTELGIKSGSNILLSCGEIVTSPAGQCDSN